MVVSSDELLSKELFSEEECEELLKDDESIEEIFEELDDETEDETDDETDDVSCGLLTLSTYNSSGIPWRIERKYFAIPVTIASAFCLLTESLLIPE